MKTGLVRVVLRQSARIGQESIWAGEATYCAGEQGKFWEYSDKLFESWAGENRGAYSKPNLKGFAQQLGLNTDAFGSCLDSGRYTRQIREETTEGERRGVTATPTFFVNNVKIEGAQPFEIFKKAIDDELRKSP